MSPGLTEREVALHHLDEAEQVMTQTRDELTRAILKIHQVKQNLKGVDF